MPEDIHSILKLRTAIAFLGEKDQFGWWQSSFLSETGQYFMGEIYQKTAFQAAVTGASKAAQRIHDDRIGRGRVSHLFRLPYPVEEELYRLWRDQDVAELETVVATQGEALRLLESLAAKAVMSTEGPALLGTAVEAVPIKKVARHYLDAFEKGYQTFPYFSYGSRNGQ